jgi:hypothetical protein
MGQDNLRKKLDIHFRIKDPSWFSHTPVLDFKDANYDLSKREIKKASFRPTHLVLDDRTVYFKGSESAYSKNGEDILELNYILSNNDLS